MPGKAFFAGAFCKGPFFGLRQSCRNFPMVVQCFTCLLRQAFPGQVFSSFAIFDNVAASMHKDSRNAPHPNLLLALSKFQHGEVWHECSTGTVVREVRGIARNGCLLPVADGPQVLPAHEVFHQTEPWTGDRLMLIGFTTQRTNELPPADHGLLLSLGFVLPSSPALKKGRAVAIDGKDPQTAPEQEPAIEVPSSDEGEDKVEDFDASTSRCRGPAIKCRHTKEWRELVDGFGLCSPGRWRPLARDARASSSEWEHAEKLRGVLLEEVRTTIKDPRAAAYALATGRMKASPFGQEVVQRVRTKLANLLPDPEAALRMPPGQPFMLHLLSQSLEVLGDPDFRILDHGTESFAEGVFSQRTTFRKLDESEYDPSMLNYRSAELNAEQLEAKFREDESAGLMLCTTEAEAKRTYGEDAVLIAAMGAVTKANGDVRPLHDGTHGINLNNKIRILDKLQVPGPEDLQEVASRVKESKEAPFALCADIKQAHRNVK
ncbi:unnamed protein product, partial [Symbiodinium sp. CCMP2456]